MTDTLSRADEEMILSPLRDDCQAVRHATDVLAKLTAARDVRIRSAVASGISKSTVARSAGLSAQKLRAIVGS